MVMGTLFILDNNHDFDSNLNNIISINSNFEEDEDDYIEDFNLDCEPHDSGNFKSGYFKFKNFISWEL